GRHAGLHDEPHGSRAARSRGPHRGPGSGSQRGSLENGPQGHRRFDPRNSVMLRALRVLAGMAVAWSTAAQTALAADASLWPQTTFARGTGFYLDPWKILAVWILFLCWVRSTDWISTDSQLMKLRWAVWNPVAYASFFVA